MSPPAATSAPNSRQDDVENVKRIVLDALRGHRARVWLFGSVAAGRAGRASDIDVAVLPLEPLPAGLLATIRETLDESAVLFPVDLVDLSSADRALRERIEREGIPWRS